MSSTMRFRHEMRAFSSKKAGHEMYIVAEI